MAWPCSHSEPRGRFQPLFYIWPVPEGRFTELGGKAFVHCHMGVNRAPSMAYRMLLDSGHDHIEALELIRDARPIAGIIYAPAAISHHLRSNGVDGLTATERKVQVRNWLNDNPVDLYWVISRIRQSES